MTEPKDPRNLSHGGIVLDPGLEPYATERQWEMLTTWERLGTTRAAAAELGISRSLFGKALKMVKRRAAQKGYAPEHDLTAPLPDGLSLKGASTRYNAAGQPDQQWVKSKQEGADPETVVQLPDPKTITKVSTLYDQERNVTQQWVAEKPEAVAQVEAWREYAAALAEPLLRVEPVPLLNPNGDKDLLAAYPVGDHHFGMLAWDEETGANYSLTIAERLLAGATDYLVQAAGRCGSGLVMLMGDLFHYDSFQPVTPTNRNMLDSDTRYPKMVRTVMRSVRYLIETAAGAHENVRVIVELGNHDLASSAFLIEALRNIYENNPRISIDTSPKHFHYYRHGQVLIGTHHGHAKALKLEDLPLVMANDRPEDWGATTYRYFFTGHVHHDQVKDMKGVRVESLRVLAAPDAYAHQSGWRSKRDMKAVIFDRRHGEVARHTVTPSQLQVPEE